MAKGKKKPKKVKLRLYHVTLIDKVNDQPVKRELLISGLRKKSVKKVLMEKYTGSTSMGIKRVKLDGLFMELFTKAVQDEHIAS